MFGGFQDKDKKEMIWWSAEEALKQSKKNEQNDNDRIEQVIQKHLNSIISLAVASGFQSCQKRDFDPYDIAEVKCSERFNARRTMNNVEKFFKQKGFDVSVSSKGTKAFSPDKIKELYTISISWRPKV